ncbi:MAG: Rap1a/Tai family immunity protein, partial [Alphaproteobacteria bacterium]|nr:Rap1a/Tai family immunity protein [Alphaproteobacteria bacterium]
HHFLILKGMDVLVAADIAGNDAKSRLETKLPARGHGAAPSSWARDDDVNDLSGNYWHSQCSSTETWGITLCLGFIKGMMEGLLIMEGTYIKIDDEYVKAASFCIPKDVKLGQFLDIFKKFLQDHPEKRHDRASVLFAEATREAFCK